MTRINTNVSSLTAQTALARTNADLQTSLTRLSTGLRINVGKDDPAGLIASENLRRDIRSVEKAISNSERANQMIATADSAMGRVSGLLNDIRGLVVEAANSGVLSDEQIAANQLQVDSSLEAIDRIAQITTFQGRRLLDGSLDFVISGSNPTIEDLTIQQANLGASGSIDVDIDISQAATTAQITNSAAFSAATTATATLSFAASEATSTAATGSNVGFTITATSLGSTLSGVEIRLVDGAGGAGSETADYDVTTPGVLTVVIDGATSTAQDVIDAINDNVTEFTAELLQVGGAGTAGDAVTTGDAGTIGTTGVDSIALTAATAGPDYNNVAISVTTSASVPATAPTAVYNSTQNTLLITIHDDAPTTLAAIVSALAADGTFTGVATSGGSGTVDGRTPDDTATANTDLTGGGVLSADLTFQLSGADGSEVFSFQSGASIGHITDAVNLVSDATGVSASRSSTTLTLASTAYGSSAFVQVNIISEDAGGTFESGLSAARDVGSDVVATVNGMLANSDGNTMAINTATLDLELTVTAGSTTNIDFTITGGGAVFQLGPDVVTNQQARVGIGSLNTAELRGVSGRLYELRSGNAKALATDARGAARVVDEVLTKVTELRGRLGAFQRTTLDTNIGALGDTIVNLTDAESAIRDADFAQETAALTRSQILVQSGTAVLSIANSNPQNVLALLQ